MIRARIGFGNNYTNIYCNGLFSSEVLLTNGTSIPEYLVCEELHYENAESPWPTAYPVQVGEWIHHDLDPKRGFRIEVRQHGSAITENAFVRRVNRRLLILIVRLARSL